MGKVIDIAPLNCMNLLFRLVALCYLFNYQRASWSAIVTAVVELAVVLYFWRVSDDRHIPTAHLLACMSKIWTAFGPVLNLSLGVGTGVFIIVLLLPNFQITRSSYKFFVDNCCIPQDDVSNVGGSFEYLRVVQLSVGIYVRLP